MFPIVIMAITDDSDCEFMKKLYLDYYSVMHQGAYFILKRTEPIDDIIQDVCIKLIDKIQVLRSLDCCRLRAYVVLTVRNVTKNFLKHRDVEQKHSFIGAENDMYDIISESIGDDAENVEHTILYRERVKLLQEALTKLPERDRDILEYKYILSMNDKEIGAALGIKSSSVREYLTRARRKALILIKEGEVSIV